MSNSLAIAAVTATLRNLLDNAYSSDQSVQGVSVTTLPPDTARNSNTGNQVNVFLFHTVPNAAWRNMDIPVRVKPGETAYPPLALNLYYIITAYGQNNDDILSHHLMGRAMSVLHDHAVLSPDEIATIPNPNGDPLDSGLPKQFERLRITPETLTSEEMYKLWSAFQTHYRISAAYQVSVVLIDSTQPVRAPLPVLTQGPQDQGPSADASLISPFPTLDQLQVPNQQPSARLGDILTLSGHNLDGANLGVVFHHPLWTAPVEVQPEAGATAVQLSVKIPDMPAAWPAGFYSLAVSVQRPGESSRRTTNQLPFSLAPSLTIAPQSAPAGAVTFTVTCSPEIRPRQRAAFLLGDREILAAEFTSQTPTLTFQAENLTAGVYFARLRVDGVDSLLVNRAVSPPVFDQTQKVTIT
jgi:hypothetical protein